MDNNKSLIIDSDLKDIMICALRYSLGRRTYVTLETSEYIIKHPDLIDARVRSVMLNDLSNYFENRSTGILSDDKCDYDCWLSLNDWLVNLNIE